MVLAVLFVISTFSAFYFYNQNQNDNSKISTLSATVASMENTIQKLNSTDGLLYVVVASSGTFTSIGSNAFNLTLNNVPRLVWFSDRPQRATGHMPTTQLVDTWTIGGNFSFAQDPPNAAIEVANSTGIDRTVIVKLSSPSYYNSTSSVSFTVAILPTTQNVSGRLSIFNHSKSASLPQSFALVTMYIDDGDGGCNPGPYAQCDGANLNSALLQYANLYGANLHDANLQNALMWGADLQWANLQGANANGAIMEYASLQNAYLNGADLYGAQFYDASLQYANLMNADLQWAGLQEANLHNANMHGANMQNAYLGGISFCQTTMPDGSTNNANC